MHTLGPRESVVPRFLALAEEAPDRALLAFVGEAGAEEASLTARALHDRAVATASFLLTDAGLRRGDRVLLAYPPSLEFVVGLLGSMMAGLIPVPVAPPHPTAPGADLARFAAMAANCGARVVLTERTYLRARRIARARDAVVELVRKSRARWPDLAWHATDAIPGGGHELGYVTPDAGDVALLQYTSGSTGAPRGVMITHGNLAHQLACNAEELGLDRDAHLLAWLPHFHDFGLISGILSTLRGNGRLTLFSPLTFIRRPDLWPELLSRGRATHTAAPNFAYELVVRKTTPAQRARWDLSGLRVAMSAAEPVREGGVRAFCEAFAVSGFRPEAFCPAYGLAEHTVGVSVAGRGRVRVDRRALEVDGVARPSTAEEGPAARTLVGCGRPSAGVVVRVVDPSTRRVLGDGRVGELWVDSPSKAAGYWGLEEASRETFQARVDDPADPRGYLRTGDLGFLHAGEVYVTGRLKDLIIVRGRNVYPQDVEDTARAADERIRPGGVAAFSVDDGGAERLVVLVEAREKKVPRPVADSLATAVRRALAEEHRLACDTVAVLAPGALLKTTSGKIRRRDCKNAWVGGELQAEHVFAATSADPSAPELEEEPDPRLEGLDPSFEQLIVRASRYLVASASRGGEKRPQGVAARGVLRVLGGDRPDHRFFAAGREFPVLLRHDNRTSPDDAAPDARVATLRVLGDPGDLDASLLDLVLLTGQCFFHRTAEDFFRFSVAPPPAREAILRGEPHRAAAAWEGVRLGTSYRGFHYHSQTAGSYVAVDGRRFYARYRLRAPDRAEDAGFVDPGGVLFPPAAAPRLPGESRPETCLRDEFAARLASDGVDYLLEVQLVPANDPVADDAVLDCTRPWGAPWRPLAEVHLDALVDAETANGLEVTPFHAPPDLGVVWARHERQSASIDHVRTIVYEVSARSRLGRPLSPSLRALLDAKPGTKPASIEENPRARIAVVGAGASGLTVARALQQRGHAVTVFERDAEVGGMCRTRTFDGVTCDLGGHMIFAAAYPTIVALAREHDQALIPDFPDCTVDLDTGRVLPKVESAAVRTARVRVGEILQRVGAMRPGLPTDPSLATPIAEWIDREGLGAMWDWMGPIFVAAGYGHLEDRIPAAYLTKSFAHTHDEAGRYQLRDGFGALWARVAAGLADVRTGAEVLGATRDADGVTLTVRRDGETRSERFDRLVVAHTPTAALGWLDATTDERDLFGRVRHLPYASAWVEVEGLPDAMRGRWCFVPEHTRRADRRGHVVSFVQPDPTRPIVALVAYGAPAGADPVALFAEDFARVGARLRRVLFHQEWRYFPHFDAEDLAAGAMARMEALQGRRRTWHASTLLSFELTECASAYANVVAERIDAELRGVDAPAAPNRPAREAPATDAGAFQAFRAAVRAEQERVLGYLQRIVAEELEQPTRPDPDVDLPALGLDSLRAASLHQRIRVDAGLDLPSTLLLEARSLRAVAEAVVRAVVAPEPSAEPADEAPPDGDAATLELLAQIDELGAG